MFRDESADGGAKYPLLFGKSKTSYIGNKQEHNTSNSPI